MLPAQQSKRLSLSKFANGYGQYHFAANSANRPQTQPDEATQWIRWVEWGKEHWTEFCETTDPAGHFESNSSQGHKEYQDRLRAIAMREEGSGKAQIAAALGRSEKFVQHWWRMDAKQVPRPPGVHEYLKTEYWRDVQILRGFGKGLGVYDEVVQGTEWQQQMAWGNDFRNGGRVVKYDKEGRMRPMGNQQAKGGYESGRMPNLDKVTQKMLSHLSIQDRVLTRPGLLWYPDGSADAVPHRHECWTALMSFGSSRILTIDGVPVLLRDGDLIVFGTQRHGVPRMHVEGEQFEDYGGRVSAVFFFMPQGQQVQGANPWRPIIDRPEEPSRQLVAWSRDRNLSSRYELEGLRNGNASAQLQQLTDLGFAEEEALAVLKATGGDIEQAAEALLLGIDLPELHEHTESAMGNKQEQLAALYARLEALRCSMCSAGLVAFNVDGQSIAEDETFAIQLQRQENSAQDDEQLIMAQIEELERDENLHIDHGALQAQFAQYEQMLDRADASAWDGRGDLMAFMSKREHLHIEQQDPSTLFALGCGRSSEKDFYELLSIHSVRVLYDLRANPDSLSCKHFQPGHLGIACKARAIVYRHVALGRDGAYGIIKHLREDEGRNTLAELVWQSQHKRTAFLGAEEEWRKDQRQAIAMRLVEAGHHVLHILSDGSIEDHPKELELPDFITGEETRLRTLEKQRLSGESKPQKSAVHRSTEAVAQKLMQPQQVIDAGEELRKATNQTEFCRIQRRLADLQRRSENTDAKAGLGPKLVSVNKWVKAEAEEQRENLAQGKRKDGKEKVRIDDMDERCPPAYVWTGSGGTSGGNPVLTTETSNGSSSRRVGGVLPDAQTAALVVECRACGQAFPWELLDAGDGVCPGCVSTEVGNPPSVARALASVNEVCDGVKVVEASASCPMKNSKASWRAKRHHLRCAKDA